MSTSRRRAAVACGLVAWGVFAVMTIAPWFIDDAEWWFSARFGLWVELTPVVLVSSMLGLAFALEERPATLAIALPGTAGLAAIAYFAIPWALNL